MGEINVVESERFGLGSVSPRRDNLSWRGGKEKRKSITNGLNKCE